jgi:cyclophilin family peptidyl-prolyl cis-trans isomerase
VLRITTPSGPIDIELAAADAPLTVHNIITLVESGYYDARGDPDARRWHRVVPNFVLQDGEPSGDGSGNSGYSIRDEINRIRYGRGVLGMALSGPDTGGGQFFITHSPQPHLDGGYTIFGRVVNGMAAADAVVQDDRILGMEIIRR